MIGEQSLASVRKSPNPKVELAASNGVRLMTDRVNDCNHGVRSASAAFGQDSEFHSLHSFDVMSKIF
jgi:hypothetical protein